MAKKEGHRPKPMRFAHVQVFVPVIVSASVFYLSEETSPLLKSALRMNYGRNGAGDSGDRNADSLSCLDVVKQALARIVSTLENIGRQGFA